MFTTLHKGNCDLRVGGKGATEEEGTRNCQYLDTVLGDLCAGRLGGLVGIWCIQGRALGRKQLGASSNYPVKKYPVWMSPRRIPRFIHPSNRCTLSTCETTDWVVTEKPPWGNQSHHHPSGTPDPLRCRVTPSKVSQNRSDVHLK